MVRKYWPDIQDWCAVWGQPLMTALAIVTGPFVVYDFNSAGERHTAWAGPIALAANVIPILFFISVVMSILVAVVAAKQRQSLNSLQQEKSEQSRQVAEIGNVIGILCNGLLLNLASKLKLQQSSQVRLSLYVHNSQNRTFIACGRYSPNPNYNLKGRTSYPDNQGCIAQGWNNDWHFDKSVPPASQAKARREYNLRHYSVPEDVTDAIGMKSTLYAVKRLDNLEAKGIAVLVVEAMEADDFVEADLRGMLNEVVNDYARVIHELRAYVPNPAKAEESGL